MILVVDARLKARNGKRVRDIASGERVFGGLLDGSNRGKIAEQTT